MSENLDLNSLLKGQLFFSSEKEDEEVFHQNDLIQLFPFGVSLTTDSQRPFLLLKDKGQEDTLPVALSPLEAGITLGQFNKQLLPIGPHKFTHELLNSLNIKPVQVVFVQIRGVSQYIRIYFSGHPTTNSIKVKADEAMSLCLSLGVPLFATKSFINQSKLMNAQVDGLTQSLLKNQKILNLNNSTFH